MPKPPTFTHKQLVMLIEQMRKKRPDGEWPRQAEIKRTLHCTTKRAKAALDEAKKKALQPATSTYMTALAYLHGYDTVEDAIKAVDNLSLLKAGQPHPTIAGRTMGPGYENYTRNQLRALCARNNLPAPTTESRLQLIMRLNRAVGTILTNASETALVSKKLEDVAALHSNSPTKTEFEQRKLSQEADRKLMHEILEETDL